MIQSIKCTGCIHRIYTFWNTTLWFSEKEEGEIVLIYHRGHHTQYETTLFYILFYYSRNMIGYSLSSSCNHKQHSCGFMLQKFTYFDVTEIEKPDIKDFVKAFHNTPNNNLTESKSEMHYTVLVFLSSICASRSITKIIYIGFSKILLIFFPTALLVHW